MAMYVNGRLQTMMPEDYPANKVKYSDDNTVENMASYNRGKNIKTAKAESKAQSKEATSNPESTVIDGSVVYCVGETLRTNYTGIY